MVDGIFRNRNPAHDVAIEHVFCSSSIMEALTVDLPTSSDEWVRFEGRDLDDRVRGLEVALRRIERRSWARPITRRARPTTNATVIAP
jgi:hypothetical protein